MNRNKRSLTLDLQSEEDLAIARELVKSCDIVVHNFKSGGMEKMGLGYEDLKKIRKDLVYCSISGYPTDSHEAQRPGYDLVIQGETGLMAINGEKDQAPLKFGVAIVDMVTGLYSVHAVLAALFKRERTGEGSHVEMSLYACGTMIPAYYGLDVKLTGNETVKCGNSHPSIVPYGVFNAKDGPLVIAVGNNSQFAKFCHVLGRLDLANDDRFKTNIKRSANREVLLPILMKEVEEQERDTLLDALAREGIPSGHVSRLIDSLDSDRTSRSGLLTTFNHPIAGETHLLTSPYRINGRAVGIRRPPPQLGEHTDEVLSEFAIPRAPCLQKETQ